MVKKRFYLQILLGLVFLISITSHSTSSQASYSKTVSSNDTNLTIVTENFIYGWTGSENSFTLNISDTFVSGFYFLNLLWCSSGDKTDDPGYSFIIISDGELIAQGVLQNNLQDEKTHLTPLAFEIINSTSELKIVFSWSSLFRFRTGQLTIFKESSIEKPQISPSSPSVFSPSLSTLSFTSTYAHGEMAVIVCSEAENQKKVTIHSEVDLSAASSFRWLKVEILCNSFILLDREIDNGGATDLTFFLIPPSNFTFLDIKLSAMGSGVIKFRLLNISVSSPSEGSSIEDSLPGVPVEDFRLSFLGKSLLFDPIDQLFFFVAGGFLTIFIFRNIFFHKMINPPPGVKANGLESIIWCYHSLFILVIFLDLVPIDSGIRGITSIIFLFFILYVEHKTDNPDVIEKFNHYKEKDNLRFFDPSNRDKIPKSGLNLPLKYKSTILTAENESKVLIQLITSFTLSKEKNIHIMNWKKEQARKIYNTISFFAHIQFSTTVEQSQVLLIFDPISCEKEPEKIYKLEKQLKEEGKGIQILLAPYISALFPFALIETNQKATTALKSQKSSIRNEVNFFEVLGTRGF